MSLSDLASLGSFVSGVAVLASLIFLYFQLRQVTEQVRMAERNQRATIAQVRASRSVDVISLGAEPEMASVLARVAEGASDLTDKELGQFIAYFRCGLANTEDTFLQDRHGLLEPAARRGYLSAMSYAMSRPEYRLAWRLQRNTVGDDFAAFVDSLIAETPVGRPVKARDRLAQWNSDWSELTGAA